MNIENPSAASSSLASPVVIAHLYTAIGTRNISAVDSCYAPNATFCDGMFGLLERPEMLAMWEHLFATLLAQATVQVTDAATVHTDGRVVWTAAYTFPGTGRPVHNVIYAELQFENGLISSHREQFDMTSWIQQAIGMDAALAAAPQTQAHIRHQARAQLLGGRPR